jgi:uncharacterized membrane protein
VIVFVASHWTAIPGAAKLAMIFGAMVGAHHVGFRLRYAGTTYHGTRNALLFLGRLLFGGAIFLIAQGFHVNANVPSLLLLWARASCRWSACSGPVCCPHRQVDHR